MISPDLLLLLLTHENQKKLASLKKVFRMASCVSQVLSLKEEL